MEILIRNFCDEPLHKSANLARIIAYLRPLQPEDSDTANQKLKSFIHNLQADDAVRKTFSEEFTGFICSLNIRNMLTENGILPATAFQKEIKNRIGRRLLPPLLENDSLEFVFDIIFTEKGDGIWLQNLDQELLNQLIELIWDTTDHKNQEVISFQLIAALEIISNRICNLGHDPHVIAMVPEFNTLQSPFFKLNDLTGDVIKNLKSNNYKAIEHVYDAIRILHRQITFFTALARRNRSRFGITISITYKLQRMHQLNSRLILLINCLDKKVDYKVPVTKLFKELVLWHGRRFSLTQIFNDNLGVLAHQITEHNSKSGEKYISNTRSEYWDMFRSACGAGWVVGILVVFKTLIYYLHYNPTITALLYCLNYAIGFVAIYLWGFTLATKQPAMTASTLSHALQTARKGGDFSKFATMIAKVTRTQTIAFIGNVVVAFPVSYCISALYFGLSGDHIMDPEKAIKSVYDQNPFISLAILHAAIAGFYLFLSGIIAGYTENLAIYYKIPERINRHPFLKLSFSEGHLTKLSNFFKVHAGPIAGNISLGFFLGSTSLIGNFFHLNLDIRHITFSSGTFGVALASLDNILSGADWIFTLLGIILIGTFNFLLSFIMSMMVALKSRNISITKIPEVMVAIRAKWRSNKREFFMPVEKNPKSESLES